MYAGSCQLPPSAQAVAWVASVPRPLADVAVQVVGSVRSDAPIGADGAGPADP